MTHRPAPTTTCIDCGVDTLPTGWDARAEYYMVHDHVWGAAGMTLLRGCLCIGCLEHRIGRQLTAADFDPDVPINDPSIADDDKAWTWRTPRLTARLTTPPPPDPDHFANLQADYREHLRSKYGDHYPITDAAQRAYNAYLATLPRCECGGLLLAPVSVQRGFCEACRYRIIAADRHHYRVQSKKGRKKTA
jgi:hypothetical protein